MFRKPNRSNPYTFGENDWTDENSKEAVTDYFLSKTKAERLAWEFMESKGLKNKFTTICPGGVFGDALDKKGGTSIEYVRQFMKGKFPAAPKWGILISDVKDVAKAHVACIGNTRVGNRKEKRVGEKIGIFVFKLLSPLLLGPLKKMKPIHSETVAKSMIRAANENLEKNIFESNEIDELVLN